MGNKRFIKKVEEPVELKVGQKQYISFSFELLHDASYTDCSNPTFFINLLQRLKKLVHPTFRVMRQSCKA